MKKKASATVEALLILPYALFFLMTIIWLIDIYTIHATIGGVVNDVGFQMVTYSYPYNLLISGEDKEHDNDKLTALFSSAIFSETYLRSKIKGADGADKIEFLSVAQSIDDDSNEISLKASYYIRPYISIPGYRGVYLTNSFYSKAYTGYELNNLKEEDKTVFITKEAEVYHTSIECRALKTTIEKVNINQIDDLRNKDGGKYYPCSKCHGSNQTGIYITPYGTKYHSNNECSELTNSVHEISIHDVGGRRICKFCQKQ